MIWEMKQGWSPEEREALYLKAQYTSRSSTIPSWPYAATTPAAAMPRSCSSSSTMPRKIPTMGISASYSPVILRFPKMRHKTLLTL